MTTFIVVYVVCGLIFSFGLTLIVSGLSRYQSTTQFIVTVFTVFIGWPFLLVGLLWAYFSSFSLSGEEEKEDE